MNKIALVARNGNPHFDILVDGRRLAEHFVGRNGAHPSNVIALGWRAAGVEHDLQVLQQVLGRVPSELPSGRIPMLVCEECGDIECGALAVRINCSSTAVTWTDWAYENGYEPASALIWPTHPESFEFDLEHYQEAFSHVAPSA